MPPKGRLRNQPWDWQGTEYFSHIWDSDDAISRLLKREDYTSQASSPSPPPLQARNESSLPKIGGSSAGFIAVVVVLASIVILSCIGVFFLLRNHNPDPYERHARRVMSGKRETSIYELPLGPPGMRDKFKGLFGLRKKQEGWVRANSGDDEWDASDLNPSYAPRLTGPREMQDRGTDVTSSSFIPPPRPHIERSATSDSIELSVPPSQDRSPPLDVDIAYAPTPSSSYPDTFSSSPVSMESSETIAYSARPEPREHEQFSVPSGSHTGSVRAMRKFDGGTKFKEVIDF